MTEDNSAQQSAQELMGSMRSMYRKWAMMADEATERMRERSRSVLDAPEGEISEDLRQRTLDELTSLSLFAESMHAEADGNEQLAAEHRRRAKELGHESE